MVAKLICYCNVGSVLRIPNNFIHYYFVLFIFNIVTERHYPSEIPATQSKAQPQKLCVVCWARGVRRERRHCCLQCTGQPGLCAAPCFGIYHTQYDYGQH